MLTDKANKPIAKAITLKFLTMIKLLSTIAVLFLADSPRTFADCAGLLTIVEGSIPLRQTSKNLPEELRHYGYDGYEFLRTDHIFKDPEGLWKYINNLKERFPTSPYPFEIGFAGQGFHPFSTEQVLKIFNEIRRDLPETYSIEISDFLKLVIKDANRRGHEFNSFYFAARTERSVAVPEGHNHGHANDLTYVRALMGKNTQIDSKNRFEPENIQGIEYISNDDPQIITLIGEVWHRTPPSTGKRLFLLMGLTWHDRK